MKRLVPAVFVVVAFVVACGGGDEEGREAGGTGGTGGSIPVEPEFAGLEEARFVAPDTVQLYWKPATDDVTPAAELTYTIRTWGTNPDKAGGEGLTYEWAGSVESDCLPRCRFNYSGLPLNDVRWFSVEVADADGHVAGGDVVLPGVNTLAGPTIAQVLPAAAEVGAVVAVQGEFFLDERTSLDGLVLSGKPIEEDFVESWDNRTIRFMVPNGHGSGDLVVKTLAGSATIAFTVNE